MAHEAEFLQKLSAGIFRVDPDGSIWRLKTVQRTGLVHSIEPRRAEIDHVRGYRCVRLGKRRKILAHRAVFVAMKMPLAAGQEINHLNGVRDDNRPENLELATRSENVTHSWRVLGRSPQTGETNPSSKLSSAEVDEIRQLKGAETARSVAARFGVSRHTIYNVWQGKNWQIDAADLAPDQAKRVRDAADAARAKLTGK